MANAASDGKAHQWDERFRAGRNLGRDPDPLLDELEIHPHLLPEGRPASLDVACGAGRHALALAERGYDVTAVDFSAEALRITAARGKQAGRPIRTLNVDLEAAEVDLGSSVFDIITVFFYLHRPLVPVLKRCLRSGRLLFYKTYTTQQASLEGGPSNPRFLLQPGELRELFADYRVLRYQEECSDSATASLVAVKP